MERKKPISRVHQVNSFEGLNQTERGINTTFLERARERERERERERKKER